MKLTRTLLILSFLAIFIAGSFFFVGQKDDVTGSSVNTQNGLVIQDANQQGIVDNIMLSLQQRGVPIKSIKIVTDDRWNPPFVVTYVLEGEDDGTPLNTPDHMMLTWRALNIAQSRGLDIGAIGQTTVNHEGKILSNSVAAVMEVDEALPRFEPPFIQENASIVSRLSNTLSSLPEMSVVNIAPSSDINGMRWITFEFSVPATENANMSLTNVLNLVKMSILDSNSKDAAKIGVYTVKLNTVQGKPLLVSVHDVMLGTIISWQDEDLTNDWFPHPSVPNK
jgi:hypothetical protein